MSVGRLRARRRGFELGNRSQIGLFVLVVVLAIVASYAGMHVGTTDRMKVVLPLLFAVAALVGIVALTRFRAFVLLLLGARASLDLFKLSGASAGNTATNTVSRGLDPSSMVAVIFLFASLLWVAAQFRAHGRLHSTPLRYAFLAFLAACACSVAGSTELVSSAMDFTRISAVFMMLVVLQELIVDRRTMEQVIVAAYVSAVFPILYTIYTMVVGDPASEVKGSFTRISGPFSQSTTFGRYLAFLIVFGVAIQPYLEKGWQRLGMNVILPVSTVLLLLTLTRGAMLGAIVGVVVVAIAQARYRLLVGLLLAGILGLALIPGLSARMAELGTSRAVGGAPTGNTLLWRLHYWTDVIPLANGNPWTGIGLTVTQYQTLQAKQPHNDFLRAYVEIGLLGLVTFCWWTASLCKLGVNALRATRQGTFDRAIASGYLGCAVALVGQMFGSNVMSNVVCLWYLMAFAAAASWVAYGRPETTEPSTHSDESVITGATPDGGV